DPVGGCVPAHVGELAHPAREIDDAPVAVPPHQGQSSLRQAPRPVEVRLEEVANLIQVDVGRARAPAAAFDARVIHEHVEVPGVLLDGGDAALDALLVGDVELACDNVLTQLPCRLLALGEIARAYDDPVTETRQLARDLAAAPAVTAADQRDSLHGKEAS